MNYDLFVSYSRRNSDIVTPICQILRDEYGINVWLDEWEIIPGDSISSSIENGLDASKLMALMVSSESLKSKWVDKEWRSKFQEELVNQRIVLICVLLDSTDRNNLPTFLKDKMYIQLQNNDTKLLCEELSSAVFKHKSRQEKAEAKKFNDDIIKAGLYDDGSFFVKKLINRIEDTAFVKSGDFLNALRFAKLIIEADINHSKHRIKEQETQEENEKDPSKKALLFICYKSDHDLVKRFTHHLFELDQYEEFIKTRPEHGENVWNTFILHLKSEIKSND